MKTARKAILLVLCVILLVVASVMGTLAYLTDTETVNNTFTVGNIDITLDEEDTDNDDDAEDNVQVSGGVRDRANEYHLLPGKDYKKDPTIHVAATSEECYLYVKVVNAIAAIEAETDAVKFDGTKYTDIADQMKANGWVPLGDAYPNVYYLAENGAPKTDNAGSNPVVFSEFMIDGNKVVNGTADSTKDEVSIDGYATEANANNVINVKAYAIQTAGFENNVVGAWNALVAQVGA